MLNAIASVVNQENVTITAIVYVINAKTDVKYAEKFLRKNFLIAVMFSKLSAINLMKQYARLLA